MPTWYNKQQTDTLLATKATPAQVATAVTNAVNGLLNGAPGALDTLKELADAIGDDANYAASVTAALAARALALNVTGTKTTAYTAGLNELIPVDATSAGITVTLPTAPTAGTRVTVKKTDATTNTVTIARGGSTDVFNKTGGSTTLTLTLQNQSATIQYAGGVWYVSGGDLPLSSLQTSLSATYVPLGRQVVSVTDAPYGAKGDGVTDDTAAINAAFAAVPTGTVLIPRGTYLVSSNLLVQDKADFRLLGNGAKIQLSGDGSAAGGIGMQLSGTIARVEISGLHIIGDGNYLHLHRGITNPSGATISDLTIHHNTIEQVNVGISVNAQNSGSIDGFSIHHNTLRDLLGIASGYGYGIHTAYAGNSVKGLIAHNRIYRAQRHAIYCASVGDLDISDNMIYGHRSTLSTGQQADGTDGRGKIRPALNIARSHNIRARGNWFMDGYDAAIAIVPNPDAGAGITLWDVSVSDNHFLRPQDSIPMLNVGDPNPLVAGVPTDIVVQGNDFYADFSTLTSVNSIESLRVNCGKNVKVKNNRIVIRGVNVTTAGIAVRAMLDDGGTNTYSDDLEIEGNSLHLSTSTSSTCQGVAIHTTLATSVARASILRNEASGDATLLPTALPTYTNPNLRTSSRSGDVIGVNVDGSTTPSVGRGVTVLDMTNSATTLVTTLADAEDGQRVTLRFNDLNSRLVFGTSMRLAGNTNYISGNRQTVTLLNRGGVWYETGRSAPLPFPIVAWASGTSEAPYGLFRLPTGGTGYSANGLTTGSTFDATERGRWQFVPGAHVEVLPAGTTTWICPAGISEATFELVGAGGSGGGAGSASAVATQVGGGGGAPGERVTISLAVTPGATYTVSVGAAGAVGTGGASGGAPGTAGASGGDTSIIVNGVTYTAHGGTGGGFSAANSTTTVGGGVAGRTSGFTTTTAGLPGCGGVATSASGTGATPMDGLIGGSGGAPATSTSIAGNGGAARATPGARVESVTTTTGTAIGGNGTTAAQSGCGGGGGGGGAVGGAGGNGGAGAAGQITVRF